MLIRPKTKPNTLDFTYDVEAVGQTVTVGCSIYFDWYGNIDTVLVCSVYVPFFVKDNMETPAAIVDITASCTPAMIDEIKAELILQHEEDIMESRANYEG